MPGVKQNAPAGHSTHNSPLPDGESAWRRSMKQSLSRQIAHAWAAIMRLGFTGTDVCFATSADTKHNGLVELKF